MSIIIHIIIAVILFFLINNIGKYAPTDLKYFQISNFLETDEAPAFNFGFRVLTPVVFIIVLSSILYYFNLDFLVKDIFYVNIYYVLFRVLFNIIIGRTLLINWSKQLLYGLVIIFLSYLAYDKIIKIKENIYPDFTTIANELWIIIFVFLYSLFNQIPTNSNNEKRKYLYIIDKIKYIENKYSHIINPMTNDNLRLKQLVYSIIIHENFNRPKAFRLIEYFLSIFTNKEKSYGIMQVKSLIPLSDENSVKKGIEIIKENYGKLSSEFKTEVDISKEDKYFNLEYYQDKYEEKLIQKYNPCYTYSREIIDLANYIDEKHFKSFKTNKLFCLRTT